MIMCRILFVGQESGMCGVLDRTRSTFSAKLSSTASSQVSSKSRNPHSKIWQTVPSALQTFSFACFDSGGKRVDSAGQTSLTRSSSVKSGYGMRSRYCEHRLFLCADVRAWPRRFTAGQILCAKTLGPWEASVLWSGLIVQSTAGSRCTFWRPTYFHRPH